MLPQGVVAQACTINAPPTGYCQFMRSTTIGFKGGLVSILCPPCYSCVHITAQNAPPRF